MTGRAGVVLAGGHSRRFGPEDKALAELGDDTLLSRVTDRLSTVTDEVIVSCRSPQTESFERALSPAPVDRFVEDRFPDTGPLAGVEAALDAVSEEYTAVVACDMPLVEPAVIDELFERAGNAEAAVPERAEGHLQPVQAVYETRAMQDAVLRMLPEGGSLHETVDALEVVTVSAQSFPERTFHDVNTRRDLVAAERRRDAGQDGR